MHGDGTEPGPKDARELAQGEAEAKKFRLVTICCELRGSLRPGCRSRRVGGAGGSFPFALIDRTGFYGRAVK